MYHLPGGGIDGNELAEYALKRELREELNILPNNIISTTFLRKTNTSVLCVPHEMDIFLIKVVNTDLKLCWEIHSVKWVSFEELYKFLDSDSLIGVEGLAYLMK